MPATNPPYPPEFRREAIRLVRSAPEERPISRVARELGISTETLRNWVKQEEIDAGEREGLTTEDQEELRRLRRENKILKQEKEVLRKATVGSTGRCNTVGFGCCSDWRWVSGKTGASWRVVGGGQEGIVGAVEGWRVHLRHRPSITQGSRFHSRDDRSHRWYLSS
jgi:transposase